MSNTVNWIIEEFECVTVTDAGHYERVVLARTKKHRKVNPKLITPQDTIELTIQKPEERGFFRALKKYKIDITPID